MGFKDTHYRTAYTYSQKKPKEDSIDAKTDRKRSTRSWKRMISYERKLTDSKARNRRKERQTKIKIDSYGGLERRRQASVL